MHWSTEYLNIPWKWKGESKDGCDCLGICKLIYKDIKNMQYSDMPPDDIDSKYSMFEKVIKYGEEIHNISNLREFDIVFFKDKDEVRHMGIMVDKFGKFLHQLENRASRISNLHQPYWQKRFYTGIRITKSG